ncbi:hypothetical protein EWN99_20655 [Salmonella enterica]|uniref:Uncharacterized protein n=1 Tax=Salmonella enterica subsp. salamae TaxID=59202 RepID=A0A5Y2LXL5_SALER|nr:hypothetical protein [Salmonella enterica]ECE6362473.1 hypothetical protein [Salmonella enterica subsp. salamae]EAR6709097.1 hypothetical protein [Salmonella enterica]ECI4106721.1 hypothetical protein [Salmonella enterica subsp. salamae]ECI4261514.1 hypothetical protein [Salmonella enterica subsp. salamae]
MEYYFINHHLPTAKTERPFIVGYPPQRRDKSTPGLTRAGLNSSPNEFVDHTYRLMLSQKR